ncbi:MAG: F0F1 ATP synthase subunit epsilon [Bacteroides sp.]|nr:F0F1 ATP synthase subunit epsilon [Bacteroides sp.]
MDMTIATPEGIVFEGKVESAKFPGVSGSFMVLPRHAALIAALTAGKITYTQGGTSTELTIQGGFVEVKKDVISVCIEM